VSTASRAPFTASRHYDTEPSYCAREWRGSRDLVNAVTADYRGDGQTRVQ
jgi:hypothetical protein